MQKKLKRIFQQKPPLARTQTPNQTATGSPWPWSTSPLPSTETASVTSSSAAVSQSSLSEENKKNQEKTLNTIISFKTLLTIVEKTLDGLPIYGPKAAVAAVRDALELVQRKKENDGMIRDLQLEAERVQSVLSKTSHEKGGSVPPQMQRRIDEFKNEIKSHLQELDRFQSMHPPSQDTNLTEKVKKWLTYSEETLAAEAISQALSDVNRKINESIRSFMLESQTWIVSSISVIHDEVSEVRTAQVTISEENILAKLNPVKTAFYDAEGRPRACLEGTREEILKQVQTWFHGTQSQSILWLFGGAGTGKTTIAQSICELLESHLGASFFFSRDDVERRRPSKVISTIAYRLAYSRPPLRSAICNMLTEDPDFATKTVGVQVQKFFGAIHSNLNPNFPITLLLFDALDECDKENYQEGGDFIPLLLRFIQNPTSRFKVVVTSRQETSIYDMLKGQNGQPHHNICQVMLNKDDEKTIHKDIERYLCYELGRVASQRGLDDDWPADVREKQAKQLTELADRLFIFASTAIKAIQRSRTPRKIIESFLSNTARSRESRYSTLDSMYLQIIRKVVPNETEQDEAEDLHNTFQLAMGAIVTLQEPLNFSSLRQLLNVETELLRAIINPLHSLLDIDSQSTPSRPIRVLHQSFPDFLTDDTRCKDAAFRIVSCNAHAMLAARCLEIMNEQLTRNMCNINNPGILNVEIEGLSEFRERSTLAGLRYACSHWWAHLTRLEYTSIAEELINELTKFTSGRLLQWLEFLSLMSQLRSAPIGLPQVAAWCKSMIKTPLSQEHQSAKLSEAAMLLYDADRMTQAFFGPVSESALQVYESALTFMPHCQLYARSERLHSDIVKMVSNQDAQWNPQLRVIEGYEGDVTEVSMSPNGSLLASSASDGTVRVWDIASGRQLWSDNTDSRHFVFSRDSLHLLSLTQDYKALNTWDAISGRLLNTLHLDLDDSELNSEGRTCGAISPTGACAVVGFASGELYVFHFNGTITPLLGLTESTSNVRFSSGGLHFLSWSKKALYVWDIQTLRYASIPVEMNEKRHSIQNVSISSDGSRVVTMMAYNSICVLPQVWNVATLTQCATLSLPDVLCMDTSLPSDLNDTRAVSGLVRGEVCVCDYTSGQCLSTYIGHSKYVNCAIFSSDGSYVVSGSGDRTIRIWDARLEATAAPSLPGHNCEIHDMTFSADGLELVSASFDRTVCWWDTRSGSLTSKAEEVAKRVRFLADGTLLGLNWEFMGARIDVCNAKTGEVITTLSGPSTFAIVKDAAFSTDGTRAVTGSWDTAVRIWNTATGECTATFQGHESWLAGVCFSPDGSRVASSSSDKTIRVWDVATSTALAVFEGDEEQLDSVSFSSDGLRVISRDIYGNKREWKAGDDFPSATPPSPSAPPTPPSPIFDLDDAGWLSVSISPTFRPRRLCWLPVERRGLLRSSGFIVALGSKKGKITILAINPMAIGE